MSEQNLQIAMTQMVGFLDEELKKQELFQELACFKWDIHLLVARDRMNWITSAQEEESMFAAWENWLQVRAGDDSARHPLVVSSKDSALALGAEVESIRHIAEHVGLDKADGTIWALLLANPHTQKIGPYISNGGRNDMVRAVTELMTRRAVGETPETIEG